MTALAKPALGQTVIDPQFGTTIRRITAVPVSEGAKAIIKPMYSTMPAWNIDESKLILWHRGRGHELYDGRTYAFIRELPLESPTDIEQVLWDPVDPDILYYPSNYNAQPRFMRYRVSTNTSELVRDFGTAPTNCPVDWGKVLSIGSDPQYLSWEPKKIIGLKCGNTKFIYDIAANDTLGVKSFTTSNAPIVAPSGDLAYFEGDVYDIGLNLLRSLVMTNPEHANIGRDANGADVYNTASFDDADPGALISYALSTGSRKVIIGPKNGWPYTPSGTHISSLAFKNPGWVAVSMVGYQADGKSILDNELALANVSSGQVCRIGHHRSKAGKGPWEYWAEPHNVISPSGTRVLFGSDWGGSDSVDSYVVELPSYNP